MSITTKKGDKGKTVLLFGKVVSKDDLRIESLGSLDELNSYLGLCKSIIKDNLHKKFLENIQNDLLVIGSEIVTEKKFLSRLKKRLGKENIEFIEDAIKDFESKVNLKKNFYIPGKNYISSNFDIARAIARRAERYIVKLKKNKLLTNNFILIYLNRLSDFLYLVARFYESRC